MLSSIHEADIVGSVDKTRDITVIRCWYETSAPPPFKSSVQGVYISVISDVLVVEPVTGSVDCRVSPVSAFTHRLHGHDVRAATCSQRARIKLGAFPADCGLQ